MRRARQKVVLPLLAGIVALTGCASGQRAEDMKNYLAEDPHASQLANSSDASFIVDCLLPGKIKKMGSSFTYLTPRRPVKVSAQDCEIRGGEYVSYDRANYETALKVWLPMAQEGDMVAQTYVAAIYEKGLGVAPNYNKAFDWYKKAADQGYSRAQYALGYLYEVGLGVEKNPTEAFNWYRAAAGIQQEDIRIAHVELAEEEKQRLRQMREAEQALLAKVEQDILVKQSELSSIDSQINQEKTRLTQAKRELAATHFEREQMSQSIVVDRQQWQAEVKRIEQRLAERESELQATEKQVAQEDPSVAKQAIALANQLASYAVERKALMAEITTLKQGRAVLRPSNSGDSAKLAQLSNQIEEKQTHLAQLDIVIDRQNALAEQGGRELLVVMNEVRSKKDALVKEQQALKEAQAKLQQDKVEHSQSIADFRKEYEQQRQEQVAELQRQEKIIAQLENQKESNMVKLAYLEQVKSQDKLALLAPKIEILEPIVPMVRTGTPPILKVRSDVQQRQIVGKVLSDQDLLLVSMNEKPIEIGPEGVFKSAINVPDAGTLVDIVALDIKGQRSQVKFVLSPEQDKFIPAVKRETSPKDKAKAAYKDIKFGDYYALLIGNNDYRHLPKLLTPIADIEATAKVLEEKYGFKETILLKDATRYDIITQLNQLRKKLTEKDNLVIYYAGHGEVDRANMSGQWLPVDAEPDNTANWISNSALTELVNAITAKHVLVVADSCYSGLLTRTALANIQGGRSLDARATWLKKIAAKRARLVLTSGGVAPVLDEGGGDHSVFAKAFIDTLSSNTDVIEGQKLFRQVSAMVAVAADRYKVDQVPEYAPIRHAGHESGDFILVPVL